MTTTPLRDGSPASLLPPVTVFVVGLVVAVLSTIPRTPISGEATLSGVVFPAAVAAAVYAVVADETQWWQTALAFGWGAIVLNVTLLVGFLAMGAGDFEPLATHLGLTGTFGTVINGITTYLFETVPLTLAYVVAGLVGNRDGTVARVGEILVVLSAPVWTVVGLAGYTILL